MPYTLLHDGVMREFDFYAPVGWETWMAEAWIRHGRVGLPLVVALHGGGNEPLEFQRDWFFPNVWPSAGPTRLVRDQFFVLYPYGMGWMTTDLFSRAFQGDPLPATALLRNEKPVRGWNLGFTGTAPGTQDGNFIRAAIEAMEARIQQSMLDSPDLFPDDFPWVYMPIPPGFLERKAPAAFDVERRFLFGYSQGAMMGYRLIRQMPDYWAAYWAMAGTCGGRSHFGMATEPTVTNLPDEDSEFKVSLFAHHGFDDRTVPPGEWGQADEVLEHGLPKIADALDSTYEIYQKAGLPGDFTDLMPGYLPLATAGRGFRDFNDIPDTGSTLRAFPSVSGVDDSNVRIWPDNPDWNTSNPEVVLYRDPNMGHTGFTSDPNRYFVEEDVWEFFKAHPRIVPR